MVICQTFIMGCGKETQTIKLASTTDLPTKRSIIGDNQHARPTKLQILTLASGKLPIARQPLLILAS